MAKISDEIRKWCGICRDSCIDGDDCDKLRALADRIDAEMVELPRDRDGMPIHVGDTVYDKFGDGEEETVRSITLTSGTAAVTTVCHGFKAGVRPADLTHTRPDSLERIANELEGLSVDSSDNYYVSTHCSNLADRIRKLAEKEDKR